jgi:dolichol-phosphate mannosyltransferase
LSDPSCLVIIPTYNERENIFKLINAIFESEPAAHILVVDDGSPDGTADVAEAAFGGDKRGKVLHRTGMRGLGRSYVDGYRYALKQGYGRVVQMDADFSHDPKSIPSLLDAAAHGDVVIGSRYCPGGALRDWPMHRILLSKFANRYVAAVTGLGIKDTTAGFRCYTRLALERIGIDEINSSGYAFQVEMTYRAHLAGLHIVETPITFTDRTLGKSKVSRTVLLESMVMPWRLRFSRIPRTLQPASGPLDR